MLEQVGVKVLTTQVSITSGSLDGEDTTLDVEQGDIESTTTQIVDQDVPLLLRLAGAETVSNSSGSRLVDDTQNVEAGNGTTIPKVSIQSSSQRMASLRGESLRVLGGLTLVVVEVGGNSDNSLLDLLAKLDLGDLLHL